MLLLPELFTTYDQIQPWNHIISEETWPCQLRQRKSSEFQQIIKCPSQAMHFVMTRYMMELHKLCRGCVIYLYLPMLFVEHEKLDISHSHRVWIGGFSPSLGGWPYPLRLTEKHESKLNRRLISYYYEARWLCSKPDLLAAMTCWIFTVDLS